MRFVELSSDEFNRFISENRRSIIDFYSNWCYPCKMLEDYLSREFKGSNIIIGRVNCDLNPDICDLYYIEAIPTLILFVDGEPVFIITGYDIDSINVMIRLYQMLEDNESYNVFKEILSFAEKHDLIIDSRALIEVLYLKGMKCPYNPGIDRCPCSRVLEWVKYGVRRCRLFYTHEDLGELR